MFWDCETRCGHEPRFSSLRLLPLGEDHPKHLGSRLLELGSTKYLPLLILARAEGRDPTHLDLLESFFMIGSW